MDTILADSTPTYMRPKLRDAKYQLSGWQMEMGQMAQKFQ